MCFSWSETEQLSIWVFSGVRERESNMQKLKEEGIPRRYKISVNRNYTIEDFEIKYPQKGAAKLKTVY